MTAWRSSDGTSAPIERGDYNPSLELALDVAAYFGLPVEAIFSREPLEPMSARLYGRPDATPPEEPARHA